jgi:hypothetical protein
VLYQLSYTPAGNRVFAGSRRFKHRAYPDCKCEAASRLFKARLMRQSLLKQQAPRERP